MEDLTGKQLGQYRIIAPIGEGGMAAVYKAYQPSMDRFVALKVLPQMYAAMKDFVKRFEQEAKVIAKLEHPNIVPVHDYGEADGYTYIAMRYVEGGTLLHRMQQAAIPDAQICSIVRQVSAALDYAHSKGILHRDLKPGNILMDAHGQCLLTDFGIAKILEDTGKFTVSGAFLGTPTYASPEQGQSRKLDNRSDVYSLGVILYEMVTGRPPFEAETPMAVILKHIQDPVPLPRSQGKDLPELVERVILKALEKEPEDRFSTAGELAQALEQGFCETDAGKTTLLLPQKIDPEGEKPPSVLEGVPPASTGSRYPVWGCLIAGLLAACLLLGLSCGGYWLFSKYAFPKTNTATVTLAPSSTLTLEPTFTPTNSLAPILTFTNTRKPVYGIDVVGMWQITFDWECAGKPNQSRLQLFDDHSVEAPDDRPEGMKVGTWTLSDTQITIILNNGTEYKGTVNPDGTQMEGTMISRSEDNPGQTGCWTGEKIG